MAYEHDALFAEGGQACDDGPIVTVKTVSAEFHEVWKRLGNIVQGLRPLRMARDLDGLPCCL
jgi:hypothetical protein